MIGTIENIQNNYTKCIVKYDDGTQTEVSGYESIGNVFLGDFVKVIDNSITLIESNIKNKTIIGQLLFNNIKKFPHNKKGVERFEFRALNSNYPTFLICSKMKRQYSGNVLCIIKYLSWNSTLPYGEIVDIIGDIDDPDSKYNTVLHKHGLNIRRDKLNVDDFRIDLDNCENYGNKTKDHIISIDPNGTKDIDDCFGYNLDNNGVATIIIHIADVIGVLYTCNKLEILKDKTTSIYAPNKVLHMLPEMLSQNILSLLPGKVRLAVSLELKVKNNKIITKTWYKSIIKNKRAYSYDQFEKLYYNNPNTHQYKIKEVIRKLNYKNMDKYSMANFDSHLLIEKLMIIMNCESCEYIQLNNLNPIYRVHLGKYKSLDDTPDNINSSLLKFLKIINSHSATYTMNSENLEHVSLGINNYGHFTSPIRRIIDCYNHALIHNILFKTNINLELDIDDVNKINKSIKRADREWGVIELEENIKLTNNRAYTGYIYMIRDNFMAYIYIDQLKINVKKILVRKLLQSKHEIIKEDKLRYRLLDVDTGASKEFKLYEKINLEIYIKHNHINPLNNLVIILL